MLSRKKKNIVLAVASVAVVAMAVVVVSTRKSGTVKEDLKSFAVEDTASITKIFLANSFGDKVLLERTADSWIVNKQYNPIMNTVSDLLNCIQNIRIRDLVAKSARENINKRMAVGAVKVEIHYTDYRIKIAKVKLLKHNKIKTYYIGQSTQDNMSNYAIMEGSKIPCVVYLPGFRGFVSPKYSPIEDDWRTHLIVDLRLAQIQEVTSTDFENPDNSFRIVRSGNRYFDIIHSATNQRLVPYDTLKLLDHLSDYRNLNYEGLLSTLSQAGKDSIFDRKFKELTITDTEGNKTAITMYHLENEYDTVNYEYSIDFMEAYNRDRFYAVINGNKDEVVLCQYFVFDRITQPFEYYVIGSKLTSSPKVFKP
ncbi:MAG: DUF4340 domain-containing protein [Lentimicrobiaceae bacterium]|nr:DUF4340 domain-containing protein [Lentimicrobiaceae bacterium]